VRLRRLDAVGLRSGMPHASQTGASSCRNRSLHHEAANLSRGILHTFSSGWPVAGQLGPGRVSGSARTTSSRSTKTHVSSPSSSRRLRVRSAAFRRRLRIRQHGGGERRLGEPELDNAPRTTSLAARSSQRCVGSHPGAMIARERAARTARSGEAGARHSCRDEPAPTHSRNTRSGRGRGGVATPPVQKLIRPDRTFTEKEREKQERRHHGGRLKHGLHGAVPSVVD
jgi:hypothetical protein